MNGKLLRTMGMAAMAAACVGLAPGIGAQTLSSPLGSAPTVAGQGQGYYSPQSAFPPLEPRTDVVPWSLLAEVKEKVQKSKTIAIYSPNVLSLNTTTVKVQGYMTPLEPGTKHRHFLLLSVPPSCPFCVPGGPESMVEVRTAIPVPYSQNPMVVEGRFQVLQDDPMGLYYRITGAQKVP